MKIKRKHLEWLVMGLLFVLLIIPTTRVELVGGMQRVVLWTGFLDISPTTEETDKNLVDASFDQFSLQTLEGKAVNPEVFMGKTVFINFWATWCPPCVAEMPDIHALYQTLDPEKYVFLMISSDNDRQKVVEFMARKDFTFPVYFAAQSLPEAFAHQVIPTTFVVSPAGKIVFQHSGIGRYNTEAFKDFLATTHSLKHTFSSPDSDQ